MKNATRFIGPVPAETRSPKLLAPPASKHSRQALPRADRKELSVFGAVVYVLPLTVPSGGKRDPTEAPISIHADRRWIRIRADVGHVCTHRSSLVRTFLRLMECMTLRTRTWISDGVPLRYVAEEASRAEQLYGLDPGRIVASADRRGARSVRWWPDSSAQRRHFTVW